MLEGNLVFLDCSSSFDCIVTYKIPDVTHVDWINFRKLNPQEIGRKDLDMSKQLKINQ